MTPLEKEAMKKAIAKNRDDIAILKAHVKRLQAEMDNFVPPYKKKNQKALKKDG